MNDRDYNAQKRRVGRLFNRWAKTLGLNQWALHYQCCREGEMLTDDDRSGDSAFSPVMDCEAQWQYQQVAIRVNTPMLVSMDDEDVERSVVHELCHVLVNEMRTDEPTMEQYNHEERVVTMLTNALLWTRRAGYDEGRRDARKPKKGVASQGDDVGQGAGP